MFNNIFFITMNKNRQIQIRLILDGKLAAKFESIKEKYGLESNAEVVRLLIALSSKQLKLLR